MTDLDGDGVLSHDDLLAYPQHPNRDRRHSEAILVRDRADLTVRGRCGRILLALC